MRFGSIDIVNVGGAWKVLEINSGVMMEALSQLPEMDALQLLKSALDQMRHFLWFYMQVMTNESETGERLRQSIRQKASADAILSPEASFLEKFKTASDAALLRYLSDGKNRKPN